MAFKWWAALVGLVSALALHGCDRVGLTGLKPGVSSGYEVRDRMGPPTAEWKNDDGSLVWEYAGGPEGFTTHMIVIGPDNVLKEIRQVLSDEYFARVRPGMGKEEVRRLLGRPARMTPYPLKKEEVWDWRYKGDSPNPMVFHVHFGVDGQVVGTSRTEEHGPT